MTAQRTILGVMLMASVTLSAAACGSGESGSPAEPPASTTRQLAAVPAPDPSTPDGVAVAALQQVYTWNPATEAPGASLARARKWLGPSLIRTLDTPPTGVDTPKPSLQWADWGREGAHVEAFTFASGEKAPVGDPDHQQYKIGIEQTVVHPDGRREPLPPATVIATVVRTTDGWRLDGFR
ncbi:hypothetical protein [Nocardia aurantia]|uniref:hypothetical protein n=1 Tax=Nocardia aurantia TaxID=2585199 RepID=UPI0029E8128A|nr:hypothetical protein [Nocardia aurantia]